MARIIVIKSTKRHPSQKYHWHLPQGSARLKYYFKLINGRWQCPFCFHG